MKIKINFLLIFFITMLFLHSCESNLKEVQKINLIELTPSGEAENINLKYTDSGRITAILKSEKMLEFSNTNFPFTEFRNGINLTLFDKKGKKIFVESNYALSYTQTKIIDLKGNVKITTQEGQKLETEQLYYDQNNAWFFTEKDFKLVDLKGTTFGKGIDFNKDFKIIYSQKIAGEIKTIN